MGYDTLKVLNDEEKRKEIFDKLDDIRSDILAIMKNLSDDDSIDEIMNTNKVMVSFLSGGEILCGVGDHSFDQMDGYETFRNIEVNGEEMELIMVKKEYVQYMGVVKSEKEPVPLEEAKKRKDIKNEIKATIGDETHVLDVRGETERYQSRMNKLEKERDQEVQT
jgi:hypothetical protein